MLKLGVTGMSKGNGHPYSWSAIVNGDYNAEMMEKCGYPTIPAYLGANRDTLGIDGAQVTHIWTQDRKISEHCAGASLIDNVVDNIEDLIGQVDAVLLARDDPENHLAMAKPFIEADVPLFIDKPLAFDRPALEYFAEQQAAGKFIMSASSMRYSAGVQSARPDLPDIGKVELAVAVGKKDWPKYGIHYLEGMFAMLGDPRAVSIKHVSRTDKDIAYIEFETGTLATVHVFKDIAPAGELNIYGQEGVLKVDHGGAYPAFRSSLVDAIRTFRQGKPRLDFAKTYNLINTLIGGRESMEAGGKTITL